ncbi:MAG: carboxypeptidase-like regulatory domain-containing protein, partial [Bacteroidota bacterium]
MKFLQCISLSFLITWCYSQNVQVVRGSVRDQVSESPIPGARVVIVASDPVIRTLTDVNGNYRLDRVPLGRIDMLISYSGYEDVFLRGVVVESGKET